MSEGAVFVLLATIEYHIHDGRENMTKVMARNEGRKRDPK